MTDVATLIARVRTLGCATVCEDSQEFVALTQLATECERRQEELRLAQCPNPRDPAHGGHCETCSGLSVARTRRLHELETECQRLRERNAWLEPHVKGLARAADVEREEKLRLQEGVKVLSEALRPFAYEDRRDTSGLPDAFRVEGTMTLGALRAARDALKAHGKEVP